MPPGRLAGSLHRHLWIRSLRSPDPPAGSTYRRDPSGRQGARQIPAVRCKRVAGLHDLCDERSRWAFRDIRTTWSGPGNASSPSSSGKWWNISTRRHRRYVRTSKQERIGGERIAADGPRAPGIVGHAREDAVRRRPALLPGIGLRRNRTRRSNIHSRTIDIMLLDVGLRRKSGWPDRTGAERDCRSGSAANTGWRGPPAMLFIGQIEVDAFAVFFGIIIDDRVALVVVTAADQPAKYMSSGRCGSAIRELASKP